MKIFLSSIVKRGPQTKVLEFLYNLKVVLGCQSEQNQLFWSSCFRQVYSHPLCMIMIVGLFPALDNVPRLDAILKLAKRLVCTVRFNSSFNRRQDVGFQNQLTRSKIVIECARYDRTLKMNKHFPQLIKHFRSEFRMDRFSLLLLEPGEIYFCDVAVTLHNDANATTPNPKEQV